MKLKFILHGFSWSTNEQLVPEIKPYFWKQIQDPNKYGYTPYILYICDGPPEHKDNQGWRNYKLKKL